MSSPPRGEVSPKRRRVEESGASSGAVASEEKQMEADFYDAGKSQLELLPAELFEKVIEFASERGLMMRASSRNLRAKIDNFVKDSSKLPLVDAVSFGAFRLPNSDSKPDKIDVYFDVNRAAAGLFYLRLKLTGHEDFRKDIRRWEGKAEDDPLLIENWTMFGAEVHLDDAAAAQAKLDQLKQWCGRRIGKVKLNGVTQPPHLAAITATLDGINFSTMHVVTDQMTEEVTQHFTTMMLDHQVKYIKFAGRFETKLDTVPLLHQLSQQLRSLHIYQTPKATSVEAGGAPIGTNRYLFGASDADWATIICDMFAGTLDKLAIVNPPHPGYLSASASDRLITELPTLNKRIWFTATCDHYPTGMQSDTHKNYVVKVDVPKNPAAQQAAQGDKKCKQYLEIKHVTRLDEKSLDEIPVDAEKK